MEDNQHFNLPVDPNVQDLTTFVEKGSSMFWDLKEVISEDLKKA
jgi:hypothetical protein